MPVLKPRNRIVVFRLSEEEYEALKAAYPAQGARTMSDFARTCVLEAACVQMQGGQSLHGRLSSLGDRVSELESRVNQLLNLLPEMRAGAQGGR